MSVGVGVAVGVGVGVGPGPPPAHWARISSPFERADVRRVKSTGCPGFGIVNVVVTGLTVPRLNAGTVTLALLLLTTVKP